MRWRVLIAGALLLVVGVFTMCEDVVDAINPLAFHPDSCAEFEFWRNDTLLVKDLIIGTVRSGTSTGNLGCREQEWKFKDGDSWMVYGLENKAGCDRFDAEVHVGRQYWEVTQGNLSDFGDFATGTWKLHVMQGDVDKIVDGGKFKFRFDDVSGCP